MNQKSQRGNRRVKALFAALFGVGLLLAGIAITNPVFAENSTPVKSSGGY